MSTFELSDITPASPGEAQSFYNHAMAELDNLLVFQDVAKRGLIIAMAAGLNAAFIGEPGGGKTLITENAHHMVDGIDDEHIARMPIQSDLQPQIVIGGEVKTTKEITRPDIGKVEVEESRITIDAILHRGIKVIFGNEFNRANPLARNSMLEAYENGVVDTTAGRVYLDLAYTLATLNPSEKREGVFPISSAEASRHAIGVAMSNEVGDKRREAIYKASGWSPQKPNSVTNLNILRAIKARTRSQTEIAFPEKLREKELVNIVIGTQEALKRRHINEADYRLTGQIAHLGRTIAAINGQDKIEKEDLQEAVLYLVGARVGMLTAKNGELVKERIDTVVAEALAA